MRKVSVLIGLLSGVGQAGSNLVLNKVSSSEGAKTTLLYMLFFSTLLAGLVLIIEQTFGLSHAVEPASAVLVKPQVMWLSLLVGLGCLFNQILRTLAYSFVNRASRLAPLLYGNVFWAVIFDVFYFHQTFTLEKVIGALLVMVGVYLAMLSSHKKALQL